MLRKDDLFKVVLDPGADKREKRVPGQTVLLAAFRGPIALGTAPFALRANATNDTGWVRSRRSENRRVDVTQLL
jgi:hypothetical protein